MLFLWINIDSMFGTLTTHEVEEVLHRQVIGRIACHADEETYLVPISYAYDGQFVYVHTRPGKKIDMMRKNPAVCFETDAMENMANWKSVIAQGFYEEISQPDERRAALDALLQRILPIVSSETTHLTPHWPFPPDNLNDIRGIVFRIRLEQKSGRFERH